MASLKSPYIYTPPSQGGLPPPKNPIPLSHFFLIEYTDLPPTLGSNIPVAIVAVVDCTSQGNEKFLRKF